MLNNKQNIFIAMPTVPYPLREHGLAMRYFPIFQHLADKHNLDVVIFSECRDDQSTWLKSVCHNFHIMKTYHGREVGIVDKLISWASYLFPWTLPMSSYHYRNRRTAKKLHKLLSANHYDTILWITGFQAQLLPVIRRHSPHARLVVDLVDSNYLHARRRSINPLSNPLLLSYENWKIKRWEAHNINTSDASIYISQVDAEAIPSRLADMDKRYTLPNGVYVDDYLHTVESSVTSPSIGFLGNMSYPPNVQATHWLVEHVFPQLKNKFPDLHLYLVGRNPDDSILELAREDKQITVTGTVDSIWPYVNAIDLFVLPLQKGAGLKNKILDIMYAGKPVITTQLGNEGIYAEHKRDILICQQAEDYIRTIEMLLEQPQQREQIGKNAHTFVERQFGWRAILEKFEKLLLAKSK